jgi:hypothetical protein
MPWKDATNSAAARRRSSLTLWPRLAENCISGAWIARAQAVPSPRSPLTNSPADDAPTSTRGSQVAFRAPSSVEYSKRAEAKTTIASGGAAPHVARTCSPRCFPATALSASRVYTARVLATRSLLFSPQRAGR